MCVSIREKLTHSVSTFFKQEDSKFKENMYIYTFQITS